MTLLLRVIVVVALSAIVLAIAYVVVTDPGSGTDVIARGHRPPVHGSVGDPVKLGRGHAVMASGPAGLWVARQPQTGPPGLLERIDTSTAASSTACSWPSSPHAPPRSSPAATRSRPPTASGCR